MLKKSVLACVVVAGLTACASSQPRIIQTSSSSQEIRVTTGMATQIEMPDEGHVQSIAVGNPDLLSAEQAGDVVNLVAKGKPGETNVIIRSREDDGRVKVFQYHIVVQGS